MLQHVTELMNEKFLNDYVGRKKKNYSMASLKEGQTRTGTNRQELANADMKSSREILRGHFLLFLLLFFLMTCEEKAFFYSRLNDFEFCKEGGKSCILINFRRRVCGNQTGSEKVVINGHTTGRSK